MKKYIETIDEIIDYYDEDIADSLKEEEKEIELERDLVRKGYYN